MAKRRLQHFWVAHIRSSARGGKNKERICNGRRSEQKHQYTVVHVAGDACKMHEAVNRDKKKTSFSLSSTSPSQADGGPVVSITAVERREGGRAKSGIFLGRLLIWAKWVLFCLLERKREVHFTCLPLLFPVQKYLLVSVCV